MSDATAESCASALLSGWVSRFGVPTTITTDRGRQFESSLWHALMNLLGTTRHRTTSYHPQANGLVERFHRHLKGGLKARLAGPNWVDELPIVLLGIRTSLKEGLDCSSAEFFTKSTPEDPASFLTRLRHSMQRQQFVPTQWHGSTSTHLPADLRSASHAYVRRDGYKPPLTRPYAGPFRVLSRSGKHFTLEVNGKTEEITIDRLKPAKFEQGPTSLTSPAPVPRPSYADVTTPSSPHSIPMRVPLDVQLPFLVAAPPLLHLQPDQAAQSVGLLISKIT